MKGLKGETINTVGNCPLHSEFQEKTKKLLPLANGIIIMNKFQ